MNNVEEKASVVIIDGSGNGNTLSVVQSTDDPEIIGIVALNPDGTDI